MLDDLLTRANAAWLAMAAILAGIVKVLVTARSQISDLSAKLTKDRAGEQILTTETSLQIDWLRGMVKDREELQAEVRKLEDRIESFRESQLNDARIIERRDAELVACRERINEAKTERDIAVEEMIRTRERLAASEEHAIVLEGQMLNLKMANGRLFAELPKDTANRMIDLLVKVPQP